MRTKETAEQRLAFEDSVKKWIGVEETAIANCEKVMSSTSNQLVSTIAGAVKADAEKHKQILNEIIEVQTGTVSLSPDELGAIYKLLDDYTEMEKKPISMGAHEKTSGENVVIGELLSYILEDDKKYDRLRDELDKFKIKMYPYGVS